MKYSSSTLKVPLNQCALRALSRVAAIFTYIEIAALRVLAISKDFLRYVNELGSGVLRNHYVIKVLYVFVFFFVVVGVGPNVAISSETWKAAMEWKKQDDSVAREHTKPKEMLLLFINECQLNFWNQVFIEAIVTWPGRTQT